MPDKLNLIITVESRRKYREENEESGENFSFKTSGRGYCKNGTLYLIYDEVLEGMEGITTIIKIKKESVELVRRGRLFSRQVFEEGVHKSGKYRTPYGTLPYEWKTEEIVRIEGVDRYNGFPVRGCLKLTYFSRFPGDDWAKSIVKISYGVRAG